MSMVSRLSPDCKRLSLMLGGVCMEQPAACVRIAACLAVLAERRCQLYGELQRHPLCKQLLRSSQGSPSSRLLRCRPSSSPSPSSPSGSRMSGSSQRTLEAIAEAGQLSCGRSEVASSCRGPESGCAARRAVPPASWEECDSYGLIRFD